MLVKCMCARARERRRKKLPYMSKRSQRDSRFGCSHSDILYRKGKKICNYTHRIWKRFRIYFRIKIPRQKYSHTLFKWMFGRGNKMTCMILCELFCIWSLYTIRMNVFVCPMATRSDVLIDEECFFFLKHRRREKRTRGFHLAFVSLVHLHR